MGRKRRNLQGISNNAPSSQEQQMLRGGTDYTKVVQRDVFLSNMEQQMFQGDTIQDGETPTMNLTEGEEQMFIEEIVRDTAKRHFRDLFLSNMEQQMFRGDTIQDRDPAVEYETPAMDLTEEELQKKRTDETRHYTELSNESNRQKQQMEKEIEHHKRENVELLEKIRAKEEEIQKARDEEGNLKKRIEELEKECENLKTSGTRWDEVLRQKGHELREKRQQLKDLQEHNAQLEEELKQQVKRHNKEERKIATLEEAKTKLEEDVIKLEGDKKKLEENAVKLVVDEKKLEEKAKQLDVDQRKLEENAIKLDGDKEKLEEDVIKLEGDKKKLEENARKLDDGQKKLDSIILEREEKIQRLDSIVLEREEKIQRLDSIILEMEEKIQRLDEEVTEICQPCTVRDDKNQASFVCPECNDLCFCSNCASEHRVISEGHMLMTMEDFKSALENNCSIRYAGVKTKDDYTDQKSLSQQWQRHQEKQDRPGKPTASDIGSDSVTLFWEKPENFGKSDYFQIGYKDLNSGMKWRFYHGEFTESTVILTNLKSDTQFVFRVSVVYDDVEGPYSEESDVIVIASSLASRLVNYAVNVDNGDNVPAKYALPMAEVANARNEVAKTRKFEIGTRPTRSLEEKTIMMIGETGTGKSTLVDGMANYILSVNWDDPFRFTIVNLEEDEKQRTKNQKALSQTEWITCYTIHPETGSHLTYTINIIDTPGFVDTRGLERDQEVMTQIRDLFSKSGPQGVRSIDAVCFLIKAPDARLTPVQSYIFQSIMSIFGKDIENNICYLITFADGPDPPVLAALLESGLPFGTRFTFNNSGLFAKNIDLDSTSLAPMFWDMGMKGFRNFFQTLETMSTKSLQMTSNVLYERNRLETTIKNLEPMLDAGLLKFNQLKAEIKLFEDHKSLIADNKDFEYTETSTRQVKTDGEMKAKYEEASGKLLTQEQLLEEMGQELEDMIDVIEDMMNVVRNCNARLAEIALRPNLLTMVDHIDLMIENEKMHRKPGWLNRVKTLQSIRKRALIQNDVVTFHKEAHTIGVYGKRNNRDKKSVFQRIRDKFHW